MSNETNRKKIDAYIDAIPDLYKPKYCKALTGKSFRAAVDSKCLDCANWQRVEIRDCPIVTCSLHKYRSYQQPDRVADTADIIVGNGIMGK